MKLTVHRECEIVQTPRAKQMAGMFDVPPSPKSSQTWEVEMNLPESWSVGVIVGPSGAGKTTVAREVFGDKIVAGWEWPDNKSILDGFPASMGIKDIVGLLSSVGFSSPPAWLRPFHVLSNGQQFRVNLARTLAEMPDLAVVDEFTSVVDRTVAQIGSAAVAKTVRRRGQKFVAVTCHYDVLDWLEPDWVYEPHTGRFEVADATRGAVRRLDGEGWYERPKIELEIARVHTSAWELFKPHHYLTASLHRCATCFVAFIKGQPVAFDAWLPFVGKLKDSRKATGPCACPTSRAWASAAPCSITTQACGRGSATACSPARPTPAEIRNRHKSGLWKMTRYGFTAKDTGKLGKSYSTSRACDRLTASFEYLGAPMDRARAMQIVYA